MVDALASGASARKGVEVRVFSRVPNKIDGQLPSILFGVPDNLNLYALTISHYYCIILSIVLLFKACRN